ncbi:MAG: NAD(P)H-dependent oxidoreductase subunit E [Ectothiorhodospiraceae bacterium]|nr:NAD(P)H-dependent oxidoreductase subunit E [Ectothiorhodospiraceae bacterium]
MFTEQELAHVEELKSRYPEKQAAIMGVLHIMQDKYGYIDEERATYVAELLELPPEHVLGVISFYEMYHDHPTGKYKLQVCTNVSCMLRNSDMVIATIKERLGIAMGEQTEDGLFSLHEAECLGSCGTAPMMSVNKDYHENLTPESINAAIDSIYAMEKSNNGNS